MFLTFTTQKSKMLGCMTWVHLTDCYVNIMINFYNWIIVLVFIKTNISVIGQVFVLEMIVYQILLNHSALINSSLLNFKVI